MYIHLLLSSSLLLDEWNIIPPQAFSTVGVFRSQNMHIYVLIVNLSEDEELFEALAFIHFILITGMTHR